MAGSARKVTVEFLGKDQSLTKTANAMETRTSRLGSAMAKTGKIAALGLAAGAVVAGKALWDMGKAAAEDQQSAALMAKAFKNSANATKGQVAQTENWITAQGKALGVADDDLRPALTKLVGATHDVGKAQKLASLAMDVSAGTGKDLGAVSQALAKAQNGNVSGLARLGIATKDANGKTISFTEAQKKMADQFGGAAATKADTLQGKMARLKLMLSETGESIGYKLLPPALKMGDWFVNKGVPAITAFSQELKAKLGPVIEWVRGLFSTNTNGMASDVSRNLANIKATFQSIVSTIQALWNTFGSTLMTYAASAFNAIRTIIGGQLNVIAGIFKTISALIHGDWSGVWEGLKQIASGAVQVLKGTVGLLWAGVKAAFGLGVAAVRGIFGGMWSGLKSLAEAGLNGIVSAVKSLPGKLGALGGLLKSAGKGVLTAILNGLKGAGGFAADFASSIWGAIKGAINGGIDKLNGLLDFSIKIGPKTFHASAPNIGHLAKGTDNWRGGPTWVGEKGPEILDLPAGSRVTPNNQIGGASSGDVHIHLHVAQGFIGNEDQLATAMRQLLLKFKRDNGTMLGLA